MIHVYNTRILYTYIAYNITRTTLIAWGFVSLYIISIHVMTRTHILIVCRRNEGGLRPSKYGFPRKSTDEKGLDSMSSFVTSEPRTHSILGINLCSSSCRFYYYYCANTLAQTKIFIKCIQGRRDDLHILARPYTYSDLKLKYYWQQQKIITFWRFSPKWVYMYWPLTPDPSPAIDSTMQ